MKKGEEEEDILSVEREARILSLEPIMENFRVMDAVLFLREKNYLGPRWLEWVKRMIERWQLIEKEKGWTWNVNGVPASIWEVYHTGRIKKFSSCSYLSRQLSLAEAELWDLWTENRPTEEMEKEADELPLKLNNSDKLNPHCMSES